VRAASRSRRRAIAVGFLLGLLAFALGGCVQRTEAPPRASEPVGPIWGKHSAGQGFTGRHLALVGLDIQLATYNRVNRGTVTLSVIADRARQPHTVTVAAAEIQDNAIHRFRFPPLTPSGNAAWSFGVESSADSPDDAITIWASAGDVVPGGSAGYGGQTLDGDLVFTPVYAEPLPSAVGVQIARFLETWPRAVLPAGLIIFPGLLLAQLLLSRTDHGFGLQLAAAPAFGLAALPILALYASVLEARLSAEVVWTIVGGSAIAIVAVEVGRRVHTALRTAPVAGPRASPRRDWSLLIVLGAVLAGLIVRSIALEDGSVFPGADTYHHALIAQLFAERGGIPTSYRPYAEIDSFSYHFGFHALAGLTARGTGDDGIAAIAAVAPLVNVLPALSIFFLVRASGLGRTAATAAAIVLALVDPLSVALLGVGRYPQSAALAILPAALAFALGYTSRAEVGQTRPGLARAVLAAAILAAGVFLTHYRVVLYLAIVLAIDTGWSVLQAARVHPSLVWSALRLPLATAAVALVICAPWLVRLAEGFTLGLRGSEGRYAPAYYALDRLGAVLSHPAIPVLLVLSLVGVLLALATRQPLLVLLASALVVQLALSNPHWLAVPGAGWVDTVTVLSSSFIVLGVAVGFLLRRVNHLLVARVGRLATPILALVTGAAATWGALQLPSIVEPGHRLVHDADLQAATWSRDRLPSEARFLVNTFILNWRPDFVAPTDAGYFLPLIAGRQTTLLPMVYPAERGTPAGTVERMEAIARSSAQDPTSPDAVALLRAAGVTHVYLGVRRGAIPEYRLAASPAFRRIYQERGVSIYELMPVPVR
jgi:hypothetical protein